MFNWNLEGMEYLKVAGLLLLLIIGVSCQPPVVFGEPQPADTKPLTAIPEAYKGIYWCRVDSATLYVDDRTFIKKKEFILKLTEADIADSPELMLREGYLYVTDWDASFPIQRNGDTIVSSVIFRDTLFALGSHQIAKSFKGHLILNNKLSTGTWAVLVVSHKGGGILSMAQADLPEDISELELITPVTALSQKEEKATQISLAPTKGQFEIILQKGILFQTSCTEFERIIPISPFIY